MQYSAKHNSTTTLTSKHGFGSQILPFRFFNVVF